MNLDIVFEGGGVKGIAFAGALQVLEESGYEFQSIAGTSAGAIVGALVAVGYTAEDIMKIVWDLDFNKCKDQSGIDDIPIIGKTLSLVFNKGIYQGDYLENWLAEKLASAPRPARTFYDLENEFKCIATDISRGKMIVLPDDLIQYDISPLNFSIARAVRMSMSIPFFFEPVVLPPTVANGDESYIVDGGVLSNYPIHIFDVPTTPQWPTFGLRLEETQPDYNAINGPLTMFMAMFNTMLSARDLYDMENSKFVRTIPIPTFGVKTTDFDLADETKECLLKSGENSAREFLSTWDWERYVKQYRS